MKKPLSFALVAIVLGASAVAPAYAGGHGYYRNGGYNNNGINGWAAAAIGAVVGVAIGAALTAPQPVYAAPPAPYPQPVAVVPAPTPYYVEQRVCQPVQVPVYDQYGRLLRYQQYCAN